MPFLLFNKRILSRSSTDQILARTSEPTGISAHHWSVADCGDWRLFIATPSRYLDCTPDNGARPLSARAGLLIVLDGFLANTTLQRNSINHDSSHRVSDLDLIKALFLHGGADALDSLQGSFALCIVELESGRVIARRDRLGARGLYWRQSSGSGALATNSASLALLSESQAMENPLFIAQCMAFQFHRETSDSAFSGVHELQPWQQLELSPDHVHRTTRNETLLKAETYSSTEDWVDAFSCHFENTIQSNLGQSGPVAVMLSGGLDSGSMAVMANRAMAGTGRRIHPVSWMLPSYPDADETRWIQRLCRYLDIDLEAFNGDQLIPYDNLGSEMISPDLPFHNPFRPLKLRCYEMAQRLGCDIILNGNAGDQLYPPRRLLLPDQWRRLGLKGFMITLGQIVQHAGVRALPMDPALRHPVGKLLRFRNRKPAWLTTQAWRKLADIEETDPPEISRHPCPDYARQLLGRRMTFGRAQENNFAHRYGIERRDPFHSQEMVQLMLDMPFDLSSRDGYSKWIMRQAMIGKMPESLRTKPRTGLLNSFAFDGFNRNRGKIHDLLFQPGRHWRLYVEPAYVEQALKRTETSSRERLVVNQCIGYTLWREYWEGR